MRDIHPLEGPLKYLPRLQEAIPLSISQGPGFWSLRRNPGPATEPGLSSSPSQCEDDIHRGLHLNGLAVKQIRTIAPSANSIHSCLLQHRRTAGDAQIFDGSGFRDGGRQHHRSADSCCLRNDRINGHPLENQQPFRDWSGDAQWRASLRTDDSHCWPARQSCRGLPRHSDPTALG